MKTFVYAIIAALLAWHFGDVLTGAMGFLPVREIGSTIKPTNIIGRSGAFYLSFLIWWAIAWVVLTRIGLGAILAGPQAYGNTRVVRRLNGWLAEGTLVGVLCLPVIGAVILTDAGRTRVVAKAEQRDSVQFFTVATGDLQTIAASAGEKVGQAVGARTGLRVRRGLEWVRGLLRTPEEQAAALAGVDAALMRVDSAQRAAEEERTGAQTTLVERLEAYKRGETSARAIVHARVWADLQQHPWRLLGLALSAWWWIAVPLALLGYVFFGHVLRAVIARGYIPVMRFMSLGRSGVGGSARFAGVIEEWALHDRRLGRDAK